MEESGIILADFSDRQVSVSKQDASELLIGLANGAIEDESIVLQPIKYDNFKWHNGSILELGYEGVGWLKISAVVFSDASNIEYCSCHSDEYGGLDLMCINRHERQRLIFDHGGDDMSSQEYRQEFTEKYNRWKAIMSDEMTKILPDSFFNSADYFF